MKELMEFLSVFAEGVLLAIAPVLASMVAAWLIAKIKEAWAAARIAVGEEWAWVLDMAATKAVYAAEQAKLGELIENRKAYALDLAQQFLKDRGYEIDLALIDAAIEAAILEQFNLNKARK